MAAGLPFPKTISDFDTMLATDERCARYLADLRWPDGYVCLKCGHTKAWMSARWMFVCSKCRHQRNVAEGTLLYRTRQPLRTWFRVAWTVCEQKNAISALGLQRALGFGSYHTAWQWLHRMRRAMVLPGRSKLSGEVEVDEAFIGGVKHGGKRGRGAAGKALVLVAVEVRQHRRKPKLRAIGRIRLAVIPDARAATLLPAVAELVDVGSNAVTDGLTSYNRLQLAGFNHTVARLKAAVGVDPLPMYHRVISLLKRWLLGTHQGSVDHAFLRFYLDEFVFRFNRRSSGSRGLLFYRLLQQAVVHPPIKKRDLLASATTPFHLP